MNDNGYSLTTSYVDESDEDTPAGEKEGSFTLICEKVGFPTLKYIFSVYYDHDIFVEKYENNIIDEDYNVILTWDTFS